MSISLNHKISYNVFIFVSIVSPIVALFAGLGLAPLLCIAGLSPCVFFIRQGKFSIWWQSPLQKVLLIFFVIGGLSTLWSIEALESFFLWLRLGIVYILGCAILSFSSNLNNKEQKVIIKSLIFGLTISLFLSIEEYLTQGSIMRFFKTYEEGNGFPMSTFNRGAVFFSLCLWPIAYLLWEKKKIILCSALTLVTGITVFILDSQSALIGLLASFAVAVMILFFRPSSLFSIRLITVALILSIPLCITLLDTDQMNKMLPNSAQGSTNHRIQIWNFTANEALKEPLFGKGIDSSRHIVKSKQQMLPALYQGGRLVSPLPLHPHNIELQIWLELGAIGLICFAYFLYTLLLTIESSYKKPKEIACILATTTCYFMISQFAFGVWQYWWISAGILAFFYTKIAINTAKA